MGIANSLTLFRIVLGPIFFLVYINHHALGIGDTLLPYVLLSLLALSELTDVFDGYLARRLNQVTELGKLLDPMADSIYRTSIFLTFTTGLIQLPMLLVFVFLYRDSVIATLRTVCALRGFALAARQSGKNKAILQGIAAFLVLIAMIPHSMGMISLETLQMISASAIGCAALYSLYSGIEYLYAYREIVLKVISTRKALPDGQTN